VLAQFDTDLDVAVMLCRECQVAFQGLVTPFTTPTPPVLLQGLHETTRSSNPEA